MLKIASYSLRGQLVRVKLNCTCGHSRIFEVQEEKKQIYFCGKCRSRKTLEELKKEASSYWRSRNWMIDCEPDQRVQPRIHVDFATRLTVKASHLSPPYCTLRGRCLVLSEAGMLIVVEDFREAYFQDITSAYRLAEVEMTEPVPDLPTPLTGRVVGVSYRPEELPQCRIGISLEGLGKETSDMLRRYVQAHLARSTSSDCREQAPPADKTNMHPV